MTVQVRPARTLLQQARVAQWTTVGWMVIEGVVAIGAGIAAHSVALTAFGVDSGIELFSSVVVLRRLLHRTESEERGSMTGGERSATKLVGFALYALIAYIVLSAGVALGFRFEPAASPLGIGLTIASLVIMAALWRWRLALAEGRASQPISESKAPAPEGGHDHKRGDRESDSERRGCRLEAVHQGNCGRENDVSDQAVQGEAHELGRATLSP